MALMRDGLWDIVSGLEDGPTQDTEDGWNKFRKRKEKCLANIVLTVSPELLYILGGDQEIDDPVEVWRKLSNQFQKRSWSNKLASATKTVQFET